MRECGRGGIIFTGENRRALEKSIPSATSSTTNPTWTNLRANPSLCEGKVAANRLSYVTALLTLGSSVIFTARKRYQYDDYDNYDDPSFSVTWGLTFL
jgi:hypothetical protein